MGDTGTLYLGFALLGALICIISISSSKYAKDSARSDGIHYCGINSTSKEMICAA